MKILRIFKLNWKTKCEKMFAKNKRYFDCDTLDEWIGSEDFFEALWDYLREEIEARAEHAELKEVVGDVYEGVRISGEGDEQEIGRL